MPESLERRYTIGGKTYHQSDLQKSENCTVYHLDGNLYTQKQLETMSESWSTLYNINDSLFFKETLERFLSEMGPGPDSTYKIGFTILTRQQIERVLSLTENPAPATTPTIDPPKPLGSTQEPGDDSCSEITQTTFSNEGIETPPTREDDEEDELVTIVLANLQAKMHAVKRRKKVAVEVEKLRRLLAEKEADLVECERVMALEVGQVKAD